jgi:hypothetical protein
MLRAPASLYTCWPKQSANSFGNLRGRRSCRTGAGDEELWARILARIADPPSSAVPRTTVRRDIIRRPWLKLVHAPCARALSGAQKE